MATIHPLQRKSTLALRQRKNRLLQSMSVPPDLLRASFVERFGSCGKPNCACHSGAKHGPFYYLTCCLGVGQVKKFLLKQPDQRAQAKQGVAAYKLFWEQLEELSQINIELLRRGEPLAPPARR
jgi:hypothetical protein